MLSVSGKFYSCGSTGADQQLVELSRVVQRQYVQFVGHGEDHMKVTGRKKLLLPFSDPAFPCLRLALWAVPVPAGVIGDGLMPALWTGIEVSTQSRGAAILDGAESLELLIIETRFVSVQKATALCAEDVGHLHGRPDHSCFLDLTPVLHSFTSESW